MQLDRSRRLPELLATLYPLEHEVAELARHFYAEALQYAKDSLEYDPDYPVETWSVRFNRRDSLANACFEVGYLDTYEGAFYVEQRVKLVDLLNLRESRR